MVDATAFADPLDRPPGWLASFAAVIRLSAPVIPAMVSQMLLGFFDTWMVSQIGRTSRTISLLGIDLPLDTVALPDAVGTAALAAVLPAVFVYIGFMTVFRGTAWSVSTFAAQAMGRGQDAEAARYAWQGVYLGVATVAVAVFAVAVARPLFGLFATSDDVLRMEIAYFTVVAWSLPAIVMMVALRAFFQGIHRPALPALVGVLMNVLNLVLNWLLIYGHGGMPRMGIRGAATATLIANFAGLAALAACYLLIPSIVRRFQTRCGWRLSFYRLGRLVLFGMPAGLSWLLDMIGWSLMIVVIVQWVGKDLQSAAHPAASNAAMNYLQIGFMPVVGVGIAVSALVGKAVGQRRLREARRMATCGFIIGGGYQLIVGVVLIVFRRDLVAFFSQDPEVIRLGSYALICAGVFQFFDAIGIIYAHSLRGAGDTHFLLFVHIVLILLLFIPGSVVVTFWVMPSVDLELMSIGPWLAGTVYIILLGGVFFLRWKGRRWEQIDIFGPGAKGEPAPEALAPGSDSGQAVAGQGAGDRTGEP